LASGAKAGYVDYQIANTSGASTQSGYSDLDNVTVSIDTSGQVSALTGGIQLHEDGSVLINGNLPSGGNVAGMPVNYVTMCTDINGSLYLGDSYSYQTPVTLFAGQTGLNPAWGGASNPSQAIQNAAWLFYQFGNLTSAGVTETGTASQQADAMAGLQLAIWESLYDTQGDGKVHANEGTGALNNSSARFKVYTGGTSDANAITIANSELAVLNDLNNAGNFGIPGYLLYPNPNTSHSGDPYINANEDGEPPQELLFAPVPEPTTLIAGALLLAPFGSSMVRVLRRKNKA
jgi:hypothetical protein